jgi:hypothetical protein
MSNPSNTTTSPYSDADQNQGLPRKKMRKGTKSCLECRRRKIKCTFEAGRPAVCNECYARGSTCIDQEHGDVTAYTQPTPEPSSSYSLRERVSQLEDLVKQVLHRLPERETNTERAASSDSSRDDRPQVDAQAAEVLKNLKHSLRQTDASLEESLLLPGGLRDDAPALSLFDNAVITRKENRPAVSRAQYNKTKALLAALNKLLPSPHDLEIILESSQDWWAIWRKMFPEITDSRCETIKESVSHSLRSEKPAELAKIMLCIAIGVHQLPRTFDWSRLQMKEDPADLMERYIATVDRLIVCDDEIAATIDGIECIMLEAKYHINMGRPRRAWLLFHRAIAFSQLLGFHRLAARADKSSLDYQRSLDIWSHLVLGDRYLSLLLGLPYSVAEHFVFPYLPAAGGPTSTASVGEVYIGKMLPIVSRVNDRNQSVTPMGYSATLRLDQELEELHNAQDPSWWSREWLAGANVEDHFDRLQAQFMHHQARVLLHMPFMLRSSSDKRYQYSHAAALEGAREMIKVYDALRDNKLVGPYICKLVDFQAFTAAMLLLLNLCGYAQHQRGNNAQPPDLEQDQRDSELIDKTIHLLKEAAREPGGVVAAQSAQALEMLARIRQGGCDEEQNKRGETCQVSIPYFGTISIGMGKQFVPIKPGTYVRRSAAATTNTATTSAGLPTPPSVTSNSTQQSPVTASVDNLTQNPSHRLPIYDSTQYVGPDLQSGWPDTAAADDPFITFDSFMAFGAGGGGPMDFPSAGPTTTSNNSSSGFTPSQQQSPYANTLSDMNLAAATGGLVASSSSSGGAQNFTFGGAGAGGGGFPFGGPGTAADLDQGWNWFGVDAPVIQ